MIFKAIRSFVAGREDALATITREKFIAYMDMIEGPTTPPSVQEFVATGFVALMKKFGEVSRSTLPDHCHENYMIFLNPKHLKLEATNLFSQAKANSAATDPKRNALAIAQELVGYYLLSRSWTNKSLPQNTSRNPTAFANSSGIVKALIKRKLTEFLAKHGLAAPE